ncbi:MAG: Crp/Fnr family transcriptional regulator [Nitrospinae bacterium]|nr:Crp/Fnr family transcriptional regulator [Nitrospinota bacterium]
MDKSEILVETGLAKGMPPDALKKFGGIAIPMEFSEGAVIIDESDNSRDIFVIYEGLVSFKLKATPSFNETAQPPQALEIMFYRGVVGELSFMDGQGRAATVVAMDKVKALHLPFAELRNLMDTDINFGFNFLQNLSRILCSKVRHASDALKNHMFL